jgi:hypothetical protein
MLTGLPLVLWVVGNLQKAVSDRRMEAYWSAAIMRASWVTTGVGFHGSGLSRMRSRAWMAVRGMAKWGVRGDGSFWAMVGMSDESKGRVIFSRHNDAVLRYYRS